MFVDHEHILSEFKKTLRKNVNASVVDLDSGFSTKFVFTLQTFHDILLDTNLALPPNRWSYHRIGFTTKGEGEFTTGIYNFKARKNTLVVIPSRVITSSKNWAPDTEGYFALFNADFFLQNHFPTQYIENKQILTGFYQPYIQLPSEQGERVCDIFEAILKEKASGYVTKNELLALKLAELVVVSEQYFNEHLNFEADLPAMNIIKRFSELVENNFMEHRTVTFYAGQLNMHPNYLNLLVKKNTGLTAKESIQNRLLLETKYLLHSTELSIKEIANKVGFNDPNYFTSFFTRLESVSPATYRASFV